MQIIDWIVLIGTLLFIVLYGTYKTRNNKNVTDYLKGGNSSNWWTIGISVMATQASAITFLSTPGQAYHDGMGFVQFYFGLPIAMVIICMVFIPLYDKLKVFTAYEYLESRFDLKTRSLTAILFLIQRGLAAGITIFAPSIILSAVLGWDLVTLNVIIGSLVIIYTVSGGTKAVSITQKQQMAVIFAGMFITFLIILNYIFNSFSILILVSEFLILINFNTNIPFDRIIGFVNSPTFKLLIFFLILLLSEFSLIQPISPPILADSEKLYVAALFSKPISFIPVSYTHLTLPTNREV